MSPSVDPFESTEEYYANHRPEYDERLFRHLADRFDLDDDARVLHLGCGPGHHAFPLAARAGEVVGMDPSEEMLRYAERRASAAGRENVEWLVGSDADLNGDLGTFRLATMGRSFHRMDRERTLERLHGLTDAEGGVALITDAEWLTRGTRDWQDEVYAVAETYLDDLPERTGPVERYEDPWDELVAASGFADVESRTFESRREWDVDGIVGYVLSLSYCSPKRLGDDADAFEEELRTRLNARDEETFTQDATLDAITGRK